MVNPGITTTANMQKWFHKEENICEEPKEGQVTVAEESESEVAQSCPTLCNPWTVAYQAPLSMGFSKQEYWSG